MPLLYKAITSKCHFKVNMNGLVQNLPMKDQFHKYLDFLKSLSLTPYVLRSFNGLLEAEVRRMKNYSEERSLLNTQFKAHFIRSLTLAYIAYNP